MKPIDPTLEYVEILRQRIGELEQNLAAARAMWRQTQKEFDDYRRQSVTGRDRAPLTLVPTPPEPPKKA